MSAFVTALWKGKMKAYWRCCMLGSLLATVLSSILVAQLLEADYHFRWLPALVATGITAALTALAGWVASYGVMRKKPLEILREGE